MGGKNKQRTKNNVRPSSSGRSAEILNNAVMLDSSLLSVGGGKVVPNLFPTLATVTLDPSLNPELAMCIKKLNKKDPITKYKALQELTELVNKSSVEEVEAVLPSWSHFYRILSIDVDCKVREATQGCHGAIVRVCGRRLAPQLRRLLPAWLQAQHDEHAPAQTLAQTSLKSTFPDNKLPEVLSFCKTEIMESISEGVSGAAGGAAPAEAPRVRAAALRALSWVAGRAPPSLDGWLLDAVKPLLAADATWRAANDADVSVRIAWYSAMSSLVERAGEQLGEQCGARLVRLLLAGGDQPEQEPRLAAHKWTCLLLVMHHVQAWRTYLDKKDLLAKRIIGVLQNGGWGEARLLSAMLLPLLANLPPETTTWDFYHTFFNSIFKGLEKKSVLHSKSERQCWITGLSECIQYLSTQRDEYVAEVVTGVHRTWLETVVTDRHGPPLGTHLARHSAACMAPLLKYWMRQALDHGRSDYDHLVRNFWQNISSTMVAHAERPDADDDKLVRLADCHTLFLQTLKRCFYQEPRKQHSIKFADDVKVESTTDEESAPVTRSSAGDEPNEGTGEGGSSPSGSPDSPSVEDGHVSEAVRRHLEHSATSAAASVCDAYVTRACARRSAGVLRATAALLEQVCAASALPGGPRALYRRRLHPWLDDGAARDESVLDVVFLLLEHMTDDEQEETYASFNEPPVSVWWCSRALSHPHVRSRAARRWLRGPHAGAALQAAAAQHCTAPDDHTRELLLRALEPQYTGETLFHPEAVSAVLRRLSAALAPLAPPAQPAEHTDRAVMVAARLAVALAPHTPHDYNTLLLALFRLTLVIHRGGAGVSWSSWLEARSSWQDALQALPPAAGGEARADAVRLITEHLQTRTSVTELDICEVEHVTSLCPYLLTEDSEPADVADLTRALLHSHRPHNSVLIESYALRHDCIVGKLNCPFGDDNEAIKMVVQADQYEELTKEQLLTYLTRVLFRAIYLRTMVVFRAHGDHEDDHADGSPARRDDLFNDGYLQDEFCEVLRDCVVVDSLHEGYAFWPDYELIQEAKDKLDEVVQAVVQETSGGARAELVSRLARRAAADGYYWPYARRLYCVLADVRGDDTQHGAGDAADVVCGNGFYHTLQAERWRRGPAAEDDAEAELRAAYFLMARSVQAALPAQSPAASLLPRLAAEAAPARCGLDVLVDIYYRHQGLLHTDRELSSSPWPTAVCSAALADYLCEWVRARGWRAPAPHWDFATLSLCGLLDSLAKSDRRLLRATGCLKTAMICRATLRLLRVMRSFVADLPAECQRRAPAAHVAALMHEWKDIFAPAANDNLLTIVLCVLEHPWSSLSCPTARTLSALQTAVADLQWEVLPAARRSELAECARRAAAALRRPAHRGLKYLAHGLLRALAAPLVTADTEALSMWSAAAADEEEQASPRPVFVVDLLGDHYTHLLQLLDAALAHVTVCATSCEMSAGSDARSVALGALLLADALHATAARARGDLALHYGRAARDLPAAGLLLPNALRLLPPAALAFATAEPAPPGAALPEHLLDLFHDTKPLTVDEPEAGDVAALACRAVYHALAGPGAGAARSWWSAAPPRASRALTRLTRAAVSPALLREHLRELHRRQREIPDTEVSVVWSSYEVVAVHTVEDRPLTLTVSFSREHPLAPPRVSAVGGGALADCTWLAVFLGVRGGGLVRGLQLWVRAVGARLQRAPQCYVCYCRLHPASGLLPRMHCAQCNNRFHTACLRKWFASSNRSNCPLCRASF